jgi:hypothetical protein
MVRRRQTAGVQLKLRFSEALRRRIERAAAERHPPHSMNAEIIRRLEESFHREDLETFVREATEALRRRFPPAAPHSGSISDRMKEQEELRRKVKDDDNE